MRRQILWIVLSLCLLLTLTGCSGNAGRDVYGDDAKIAGEDRYQIGSFSGNVDSTSYSGTFLNASGSRSLWVYSASAPETHEIDCTLSLEKGRAKLVLVTPEGSVATLLEVSATSPVDTSVLTLEVPKGESVLKIVMDDVSEMTMALRFDGGTSWQPQGER